MLSGWLSPGDGSVIVALIVAGTGIIASRSHRAISRIDRAVNHQPDDAPTLIQRVIRLEENQAVTAAWTGDALLALAGQIGVELPPRPPRVDDVE